MRDKILDLIEYCQYKEQETGSEEVAKTYRNIIVELYNVLKPSQKEICFTMNGVTITAEVCDERR